LKWQSQIAAIVYLRLYLKALREDNTK